MKLFTQELTYQDPLKPIDNREFMAQMAQFSALQQAKETLRKGTNAIIEYGFINADMAEICRQLRGSLDLLVRFCKQHPEVCSAENMVEQMLADCPQPKLWDDFNRLVNYKKGVEDGIKKQADDAQRQVDKNGEEQRKIIEEAYRAKQEQDRKAAELQRLIQQEEQETEKELEKQTLRDDSARAIRRMDCEEFLRTQAKTKEEAGAIETVLKLKKQIQKLGENVKKASEYGDKLTRDRYKEITDSLRSIIDGIIGPLKQFDKFKKEVDKWLEVKDDLEKIFSETNNETTMKVMNKKVAIWNLLFEYPYFCNKEATIIPNKNSQNLPGSV